MKNEDYKIGNCYKSIIELPISFTFHIPGNSNIIYLGFKPFMTNGKMIKLLYMGNIYHFATFQDLNVWFDKL